jgi:hypothetical protein
MNLLSSYNEYEHKLFIYSVRALNNLQKLNKHQRPSPNPVLASKKIIYLGHVFTPPYLFKDMFDNSSFQRLNINIIS